MEQEKKKPESVLLPIGKIKPNNGQIEGLPKNPRLIRDEKFQLLKDSITENPEMLELRPLLVYGHEGDYITIGGNMRYRACKELGYKELPCVIIPPTATIEQLKAYTIKDNGGFGEWDYDLLANEWDAGQLNEWGVDVWEDPDDDEKEPVEDDFNPEEEPIVCKCKRGEIWQLGKHRIMCGDSTQQTEIQMLTGGVK